jgi:hypothetical protein
MRTSVAKTTEQPTASDKHYELNTDSVTSGKGRPTPTRKEKEAARKQPLVSSDRAAARRTARTQMQLQRERARIGMANGEEKYLPVRDRGPQKRYVRDYVDARWNAGELLMPLLVAVILTYFFPDIASYALLGAWAVIALVAIDCIVMIFRLRAKLRDKFGAAKVERGIPWYAAMRAIQLRVLRLPKPQVNRGQYPS